MNEEIELRLKAEAGERAKVLLENETLRDAFQQLEQHYTNRWKAAQTVTDREMAWHAIQATSDLQGKLSTIASNGTLARAELITKEIRRNAARSR